MNSKFRLSSRCRFSAACWIVVAISQGFQQRDTCAQERPDVVWLEPTKAGDADSAWYPGGIAKVSGNIQAFDHKAIKVIVDGDSTVTAFPSHRVLWIEYGETSESEAALNALLEQNKSPAASTSVLRNLVQDKNLPAWRKQIGCMRYSYSCFRHSSYQVAMEMSRTYFGRPTSLALAWLPIAWTRNSPGPPANGFTVRGDSLDSLPSRLVYLSWNLPSLGRARALAQIDQLISDESSLDVHKLAKALRWRLATPPEVIQNADQWERELDALPMVLQVGPTRALIEKFEAAGLTERAAKLKWSLELTPPFPYPK